MRKEFIFLLMAAVGVSGAYVGIVLFKSQVTSWWSGALTMFVLDAISYNLFWSKDVSN